MDSQSTRRRQFVAAENRVQAIRKFKQKYPVLNDLYDPGPNQDGKAGWVNAIKDQHESAYRLIFYLDRLPLGKEHQDQEAYEIIFGQVGETDQPNYPRVLFTTTGAVNLVPDSIPDTPFPVAVKTDSLEIVPVAFDRDYLTAQLIKSGYAYVCLYDGEADALRILDLADYTEVMVVDHRREVQVRTEEEMVVGDATFIRPFFLKYRVKEIASADDPKQAAIEFLSKM